jgi:two-component system NtrC family response regulator
MILIIDDDAAVRSSLSLLLRRAGYDTGCACRADEAVERFRDPGLELILMDMNFTMSTSGEEGLALLRRVRVVRPEVPVILMTAWATIALAVEGMRCGAFDFIAKPWNNAALIASIRAALELNGHKPDEPPFRREASTCRFDKIIGCSPSLMEALGLVERIARTDAPALITGESGTGKELIAEAIHLNSARAREPFVKVNLGGLSCSLFESEMFGHKRGAFTDACSDRVGRFELAGRGTIFLDEIGELDLACQVKLLRVLQDRTYEALGDSRPRRTEARVVSATNRPLREMVSARSFREDLYYRINLITIHLPPLRERCEDIPLLAEHFLAEQSKQASIPPVRLAPGARDYLMSQPWPGNIRELKNLVERTFLISGKSVLDAADFASQASSDTEIKARTGTAMTLEEMERQSIIEAITKHHGNISRVASALGISRAALYRRLDKYNIKV